MGSLLRPEAKGINFVLLPRLVGRAHGFEIRGHQRHIGEPWACARVEVEVAGDAFDVSREERV